MERRKLKKYSFCLKLGQEDYEKLMILVGDSFTYTDVITTSIRGAYYSKFKTNELPKKIDESLPEEIKNKIKIANLNWLEGVNQ